MEEDNDLYTAEYISAFDEWLDDLYLSQFINLETKNMENPIIKLAEKCQKEYGKNLITRVIGKTGPDHIPSIEVQIELPNGCIYVGVGSNQKLAKQVAARIALSEW